MKIGGPYPLKRALSMDDFLFLLVCLGAFCVSVPMQLSYKFQ